MNPKPQREGEIEKIKTIWSKGILLKVGDKVQIIKTCSIKLRRGMKGKIIQVWKHLPYVYFVKFRTKKVWFTINEVIKTYEN